MERILEILENDCTLSLEQIGMMTDKSAQEVADIIDSLRQEGIILKNKSVINWEKTDKEFVTALIELKVTPQRGGGFDKIAERIYQYPEVKSLYLMAGAYDLMVTIEGRTMKEVALFVSTKLAPMEQVMGTATHFVLKNFKVSGMIVDSKKEDIREVISI